MDADLLCHLTLVGRRLARGVREALPCDGVMLVLNNEAPCQTLFHAHLHVAPRRTGDAMDVKFGLLDMRLIDRIGHIGPMSPRAESAPPSPPGCDLRFRTGDK